jgi:hypothetical protein
MGDYVQFRLNVGKATFHSMFDGDDEVTVGLGSAYFSGFTMRAQQAVYGVDWADCLTYGPEGETEVVGSPDCDGFEGWYVPDWDRAVQRVDCLLAAWESTTNEHRKEYDSGKIHSFRDLIYLCAKHPQRDCCEVRIG